jgi:hypothetical protein
MTVVKRSDGTRNGAVWDLEKLGRGNGSVLTTFELVPIMPPGDPVAQYMRDGFVRHGRPSIHVERVKYFVGEFASILWGRHCLRFASGQALPPII